MSRIAQENLLSLCSIFGFAIADKSEPEDICMRGINPLMNALGVNLSFPPTRLPDRLATASLPADKQLRYIEQTDKVAHQATLRKTEAESITGRAVYVSSAIWGRVARAYEFPFRKIAEGKDINKKIWQKAAKSLAEFYRNSQPRTIRPLGYTRPHAVIATDARGNLGDVWGTEHLGGVCFWTHHAAWFSDPIREGLIKTFNDPDAIAQRQHRINKAEAIAALLALIYWREPLAGHQVILLIDNMAAEGTLHRGYSPDADLCRITNRVWQICNAFDISLWIDRVPSDDNIGDPLSRGDFSLMEALGIPRSVQITRDPVDFEYLVARMHSQGT